MSRSKNGRIHLLDECRGFAIVCMVVFHGLFTLSTFFDLSVANSLLAFFEPAVLWFAGAFIVMSGISCRLSRSNAKRGARLLAIAVALTAVTWLLEEKFGFSDVTIWFGILHLLAVCMLLYAALKKPLDALHPLLSLVLFGVLFVIAFPMEDGYLNLFGTAVSLPEWLTDCPYLFPFGILSPSFASADYYPLFPWVFLFFIGASFGRYFADGKLPKCFYNEHIRPLGVCGRYTLWIYLAHQPVIYGVAFAVAWLIRKR